MAVSVTPTHAAGVITVTTTSDTIANEGFCSLREAIVAANTNANFNDCVYPGGGPDDVIVLQSGSTYTLSRAGSTSTTGDLDIGDPVGHTSGNLTIQASGSTNAIIDANDINRVMEVDGGDINLTLDHITLTNGNIPDKGAGLFFWGNGTLTLTHSTVSSNIANTTGNCGAGIYNNSLATIIISDSTVEDNTCVDATAAADGGGMYKAGGGVLTITNSTFANNYAPDNGGGLRIEMPGGTATITNSTFANNTAGTKGGGVQVKDGTVTIEYSTFSGNTADSATPSTGGAVQADGGTVSVANSILANSITSSAAGKDCDQLAPGVVTLSRTLVELNSDCGGSIVSNFDPNLGALANNGGTTRTMALLDGSPAINLSNDVNCPASDQRGVTRPQGAHCDLGAFEYDGDKTPPDTTIDSHPSNPDVDQTPTFTFSGNDFGGSGVASFMCKIDSSSYSACTSPYTTLALSNGSHTFRVYAIDYNGNSDPTPATYTWTVSFTPTVVSSIVRAGASPTSAASVDFTVTFSAAVTGVDTSDFALTTTGVTGASVTGVSGSGTTYTVSVNTGSNDGTIRLDLVDNDSIIDVNTNSLGGAGVGNANFTTGQVYTLQKGNGIDTTGVFRPSNGALYLKNTNSTGFADVQINYGQGGDYPITGDWNGDGIDTIGIYRNGSFYLRNSNTIGFADSVFQFGARGDQPVAGDWDGDGTDTIGVYRNGVFYLRNSNTPGPADMIFSLGVAGDVGIAGDWDGDGITTTGVFRPSNGALYLKNKNITGIADIQINYGLPGDKPVIGDWDNDGVDTIGVYRNGTFYLRNSNTIGFADLVFDLGVAGDMPIAGHWDGSH